MLYKHSAISVIPYHDLTKRTVCWQDKFFLVPGKTTEIKTNKFFKEKDETIEGAQNMLQNKFIATGEIVLKQSANYPENDNLRSHILSKQFSDNALFKCWKGFENLIR